MNTPGHHDDEAQQLLALSEDLQTLRDTLMRLSLHLHDYQFSLGQRAGQTPELNLAELMRPRQN